jgi:hypothetical protein
MLSERQLGEIILVLLIFKIISMKFFGNLVRHLNDIKENIQGLGT